ncbi:MAG: YgjV family protein, partial [Bacillota bacterium]|nr:YgjV family protein [Bacillota bacterium]
MMILIGNIISFIASIFFFGSCISKKRSMIFYLLGMECVLLAVASIFFNAYAGITTLALCAIRNFISAKDKYTTPVMYTFLILTTISGLIVNNRGFIGLLPVIATAQYIICSKVYRKVISLKVSLLINTLIWIIYSFFIQNYSSALSDSIAVITIAASITHMVSQNKKIS